MGYTHGNPTDYFRTVLPHSGITMKDNFVWPGLILFVVAIFGLFSTMTVASYGHYEWLPATGLICVLSLVARRTVARR